MTALCAVIPSDRVLAREFVSILARNGIPTTRVGEGFAIVGLSAMKVEGVLVVVLDTSHLRLTLAHAGLCGVRMIPLERGVDTSRANVL